MIQRLGIHSKGNHIFKLWNLSFHHIHPFYYFSKEDWLFPSCRELCKSSQIPQKLAGPLGSLKISPPFLLSFSLQSLREWVELSKSLRTTVNAVSEFKCMENSSSLIWSKVPDYPHWQKKKWYEVYGMSDLREVDWRNRLIHLYVVGPPVVCRLILPLGVAPSELQFPEKCVSNCII